MRKSDNDKKELRKVVLLRGVQNGVLAVMAVVVVMMVMKCVLTMPVNIRKQGTVYSVLSERSGVEKYLTRVYSNKQSVKITCQHGRIFNSPNYSQANLRAYYNANNGTLPDITDGICWATAITSLLKYEGVAVSKDKVAYNVIANALYQGYATAKLTGMGMINISKLATLMLNSYGINKEGTNEYYNVYNVYEKEIRAGRVALFAIKDHVMLGCGYLTYNVTYTYNTLWGAPGITSVDENFAVVNDGWSDINQYSYFPAREIGTNVATRWDFGICKFR